MLLLFIVIILPEIVFANVVNTARFFQDDACTISYNSSLFDTLESLNTSQILTRINQSQAPCIQTLSGYARYRCQQTLNYSLIDLIEWDRSESSRSECHQPTLPMSAKRRYYASNVNSPMQCLQGHLISDDGMVQNSVVYAQFNCSDEPEDPRLYLAEQDLVQHQIDALTPNFSAPIQYMRVFTDSSCSIDFNDDYGYLYARDVSREDFVMPEDHIELHELLANNKTLQLQCAILPMPYRRSIEMFIFQGYQAQYGSSAGAKISIFQMSQWLTNGPLFDTNTNATCNGEPFATYMIVSNDASECHKGTFISNGTTSEVWAQFQTSNDAFIVFCTWEKSFQYLLLFVIWQVII